MKEVRIDSPCHSPLQKKSPTSALSSSPLETMSPRAINEKSALRIDTLRHASVTRWSVLRVEMEMKERLIFGILDPRSRTRNKKSLFAFE